MDDLISRQAAIKYLMTNMNWYDEDGYESDDDYKRECITELINGVPSAQPETAKRIVGKSKDGMALWYQCDMCNEPVDAQDNFCRGCGRRLIDG